MLNGPDALVMPLSKVPDRVAPGRDWFFRPVPDSEVAGRVIPSADLRALARRVMALDPEDVPGGSLRPDTEIMLTPPARIEKEWRLWIVADQIVTYSLYKEGRRVIYRPEIDADALDFAHALVRANPDYAPAYVMDICRMSEGLKLLETNCLNAAGFYAADVQELVSSLEALPSSMRAATD